MQFTCAKRQRPCRATINAVTAMIAVIDRMRVMTIEAIEIATLKENDQAIAWSIHTGKVQNTTNDCRLVERVTHSN
ncbi:hypothetical protein VIBRN418_00576 [Vibrio sp. N418]|nr:hypothetical protein VIBRN418_00576 [Vibrio sp. N418]